MGLKISKQDFFSAYSNEIGKFDPKKDLEKKFSLSHKLYDAKHLIAHEKNTTDRTRLYQIVDQIYLKEHHKHNWFEQIILLFKNVFAGRGFCLEETLYKDINKLRGKELEEHKSKEFVEPKKTLTLTETNNQKTKERVEKVEKNKEKVETNKDKKEKDKKIEDKEEKRSDKEKIQENKEKIEEKKETDKVKISDKEKTEEKKETNKEKKETTPQTKSEKVEQKSLGDLKKLSFDEMSRKEVEQLMRDSEDRVETFKSICTYLDENSDKDDFKVGNFTENFQAAIRLLNDSQIKDICQDDIFQFHTKFCSFVKLSVIFHHLPDSQLLTLITRYKFNSHNSFTTFFNLVSHDEGDVQGKVLKFYRKKNLGAVFKNCPIEVLSDNSLYGGFQFFLDQFIDNALEDKKSVNLNVIYENNPELFKLAVKNKPRSKFEFWEKDSPEKQKFLDDIKTLT